MKKNFILKYEVNRYVSLNEWKEHVIKLMNQMSNIKYYFFENLIIFDRLLIYLNI
jgi:hypothetical protein